MRIAYLVNQYPKVSHTFIRREIRALETHGVSVFRMSIRRANDVLQDPDDIEELARTHLILEQGLPRLFAALLGVLVSSPIRFASTFWKLMKLSPRHERPAFVHLGYFVEACMVATWARKGKFSHIHAHFGTNASTVAMLAGQLAGIPFSMTVHGPEEFERASSVCLKDKVEAAKFVLAISSFARSQIFRWTNADQWPKVHVVRCGIDAKFKGEPASPRLAEGSFVCVGRLCVQKAQRLLLDALKLVRDGGHDIKLVLAGDGPTRSELEAHARCLGLTPHVRITGWISTDTVRDELLDARALVLPSLSEGLPVVIMEALALRRPVITTHIAGIPELVEHGVNGWLIAPGDVTALARAIVSCADSTADELSDMGDRGRARALAMHDVDAEARKIAELLAQGDG